MENLGGRQTFQRGIEVCLLALNGQVAKEIYVVEPPSGSEDADFVRADRKGHVYLKQKGTNHVIKVHHRRILDISLHGKSVVLDSGNECVARCPRCQRVCKIESTSDRVICPQHGEFEIHWLGERQGEKLMVATKEKTAKKKSTKSAKKAPREPIAVDFEAMKDSPNCELWTKSNVAFDHPGIDVRAHVLLHATDQPRKLCFNSYDGTHGKKGEPIPLREFLAGKQVRGSFPVKDLEKERATLARKNYEKS